MIKVKLTKLESVHNNLQQDEFIGHAPADLEVGERFALFYESGLPGYVGSLVTSVVVEILKTDVQHQLDRDVIYTGSTKTVEFKTKNSTYRLEYL